MSHSLPDGFTPSAINIPAKFSGIIEAPADGKPSITQSLKFPTPRLDEIIIRNIAVAINPCDWKTPRNYPSPGARVGCEFFGSVLAIGPDAQSRRPDIQIGDRICGAIHGSNPIDHDSGSFSDYLSVPSDIVIRLPQGFPIGAGASLGGTSLCTLALTLWESLKLQGTPSEPLTSAKPAPYVLVYGGSTATGTMALQLLKLSGYKTVTTCSPRNFELVKEYGADAYFDYHSPTCTADIKAYTRGGLSYVIDVITDATSQTICHSALGRAGGIYAALERPLEVLNKRRRTVRVDFVVGWCALGREVVLTTDYSRPADPKLRDRAARLFREMQAFVEDGRLRPHPHRVVGSGYDNVLKGLKLLEKGVSGERLVVLIE
ncbi:zinc-binding dehydrogenase family [Phlyctema vagabunda]|uniref:Zinc-binding dehydrogenase family n=1 Tax=Phlyctema vagabunda TaxID=108571 RepID=A0ABR4PAS4_9HELO